MRNLIAFNAEATTTFAALSATRLVGTVRIRNTSGSVAARISGDGGSTFAAIPANGVVELDGVDLATVSVRSESGTVTLAVTGNSR